MVQVVARCAVIERRRHLGQAWRQALLQFPLLQAIFGRRARRFGLGMEIPSGPLAFKSSKAPSPLSEPEPLMLVAAATGVSG